MAQVEPGVRPSSPPRTPSPPRPDALGWRQLLRRGRTLAKSQRIFVNRSISLQSTALIGFDMDYTLAVYKKELIERLAFEKTIEKLVGKGYPEEIRRLVYDPRAMVRGLVVDRKLGNILKTDQYGYVCKVYHGLAPVEEPVVRRTYAGKRVRLNNERFHSIDTLFGLPEAHIYADLVAQLDRTQAPQVDYWKLFDDVRECLDMSHRDHSIKAEVMAHPDRYIARDKLLAPTLQKLRESGKRLFLLTNSAWDYTQRVMEFLLDGHIDDYPGWQDYFDRVVVDAAKPEFFRSQTPFEDMAGRVLAADDLKSARLLRRGNHRLLEKVEGKGGESVLFVGDHIYGDILRSKESGGWRTAMIVEELEEEIQASARADAILARMRDLEAEAAAMDFERNRIQRRIDRLQRDADETDLSRPGPLARFKRRGMKKYIERLTRRLARLDQGIMANDAATEAVRRAWDRTFNERWGPLFKDGHELSRFGQQVQRFACLYTARVSNFLFYPTTKVFRSPIELLPHDH